MVSNFPPSIAIRTLTPNDTVEKQREKCRNEINYLEGLNKIHNPFANDQNYQLVKGNVEYGVAVLYPQIHHTPNLANAGDGAREIKHQIYLSQKGIFQDLLLQNAEHIYAESVTLFALNFFETNIIRDYWLKQILYKFERHQELNDHEIDLFIKFGGAIFYALHCRAHQLPVKLHVTMSAEDYERVCKVAARQSVESHEFMTTHKEEEIEKSVLDTTPERQGKPAFIVCGRAHQFFTAFSNPNSPAFYRRVDYPGLSEEEIRRVQYHSSNMINIVVQNEYTQKNLGDFGSNNKKYSRT